MPNTLNKTVKPPHSPILPRKPLKRSASVASLPTPPRTRRDRERRKSSRSSAFSDDSTDEEALDSEIETSMKRRKLDAEDEEDIFWMGGESSCRSRTQQPSVASDGACKTKKEEAEDEDSSPPSPDLAPHLLRKSKALASGASSLASPPPSRRPPPTKAVVEGTAEEKSPKSKPAKVTAPKSPPLPALALPLTPQKTRKRLEKRGLLLSRDSPDNPFLDDGKGDDLPEKLGPAEEKPTLTYVFRGKKTEFANPYYAPSDQSTKCSHGPAPHELPIIHPDYSPDMRCPPKRLFAKPRRVAPLPKRVARCSTSSADEDEDDDGDNVEVSTNIARTLFKDSKSSTKQQVPLVKS